MYYSITTKDRQNKGEFTANLAPTGQRIHFGGWDNITGFSIDVNVGAAAEPAKNSVPGNDSAN